MGNHWPSESFTSEQMDCERNKHSQHEGTPSYSNGTRLLLLIILTSFSRSPVTNGFYLYYDTRAPESRGYNYCKLNEFIDWFFFQKRLIQFPITKFYFNDTISKQIKKFRVWKETNSVLKNKLYDVLRKTFK